MRLATISAGWAGIWPTVVARDALAGRHATPVASVARRTTPAGRPVPSASGHFATLDLLRGLAALAVVFYHYGDRVHMPGIAPHGYLAVDFFFALSGFVVTHAYAADLASGRLGVGRFVLIRLARLLPLIVLGVGIAAAIELFRPTGDPALHRAALIAAFLRGLLVLPTFRTAILEPTLFPLDGPEWSLFLEIVANVAFAALVARGRVAPALVAVVFLVGGAIGLAFYLGPFEDLRVAGVFPSTFAAGFARVAFSFSAGVLLCLRRPSFRIRVPATALALATVAILAVPTLSPIASRVFDVVCLACLFPVLIASAAATEPGTVRTATLARWSGLLSYPLYAIHYPLARAVSFLLDKHHVAPVPCLAVVVASVAVFVGLAAVAEVAYDRPIRAAARRALRPRR